MVEFGKSNMMKISRKLNKPNTMVANFTLYYHCYCVSDEGV